MQYKVELKIQVGVAYNRDQYASEDNEIYSKTIYRSNKDNILHTQVLRKQEFQR